MRFNIKNEFDNKELLLYSLGLGPFFTVLIIYYSFLLIPSRSSLFYLTMVGLIYLVITIFGKNHFKPLLISLYNGLKKLVMIKGDKYKQISHILFLLMIFIPITVYLIVYLMQILPRPLMRHDMLNYGITGKMLFEAKSLGPVWINDFAQNGYLYKILHAPSFALMMTWEQMINSLFHVDSDIYFRSIGAYYGLLILSIQFYWVSKQNKWLAVFSSFALLTGYDFLSLFIRNHIDSYRIYMFVISLIFMAYSLKYKDNLSLFLFGMSCGFSAFAHRIGIVIACINCFVFFITMDDKLKSRVIKTGVVVMLMLSFGGSHYLLDFIFGQGQWLYKD